MTPSPTRLLITLACCLATAPAMAAKVTKIEVAGLPDEAMQDNVRSALSLSGELDKDITARRLNYLLRQAESETREALEPFGYYSPTITVDAPRDASDNIEVTVHVVPGEPVRIMASAGFGRDPLAVRVGHTTFALRRHEADRICVTPGVADAH